MCRTLACLAVCFSTLWSQPTAISRVLSRTEVEALAAKVAQDPSDETSQVLLGKNYAYFVLGITRLKQYDRVDGYDKAKAESDFSVRVRRTLADTTVANIAGEAGYALWNLNTQTAVYRSLHGEPQPPSFAEGPEAVLAAALINRAVDLEPGNQKWRTYRSFVLQFWTAASPSKLDPQSALQMMKADLAVVTGETRSNLLVMVTRQAARAGKWEEARAFAQQALADSARSPVNWNTGNEIFAGNLILGQAALRSGDRTAAARYLVAAGATPGSPQLNSFGPSMTLAKELLDANAGREQVIQFLQLCSRFWKMDQGKLEQWIAEVKQGLTPDFGVSLRN